ncbi:MULTISPECIES: hypothetical protein [unclassified Mammaliicoccus]|uniref:hypothetical protein n=1 Tax=Mammaliicoccus TaxID=2803850 RepID=UPI001EFC0619|nr:MULTISPECIES: hypothetical protein [unclassified Mammaliicoccus]
MKLKNNWFGLAVSMIIIIILLLIIYTKSNENLNDYEKQELDMSYQEYLSKGVNN